MSIKTIGNGIASIIIENGKLSIGRTMLLIAFLIAVGKWYSGVDIPPTHLNVLMAMLAYVLGSKVVGNVSDTVKKLKEVKDIVVNNVINNNEENNMLNNTIETTKIDNKLQPPDDMEYLN